MRVTKTSHLFIARALWTALLISFALPTSGFDNAEAVNPFTHTVWHAESGLPNNTVRSIVQTRDGYIWLATEEGLARFDGVRFTIFDKTNTTEIKNNDVNCLLEDKSGNLWIGTHAGLLRLSLDHKFTLFSVGNSLPDDRITTIAEDSDGDIWIGTLNGLSRLKNGEFTNYDQRNGLSDNHILNIHCSRSEVWIGTNAGLDRYADGMFTSSDVMDLSTNPIRLIHETSDGSVWVALAGGGLDRIKDTRITRYTSRDGLSNNEILSVCEDSQGTVWIGSDKGLNQFKNGRLSADQADPSLRNLSIMALYYDAEGSLWIGTSGDGLHKLSAAKFVTYSVPNETPDRIMHSIIEDRSGRVWIGSQTNGISLFENGHFRIFTTKDGLSNNSITSLAEDNSGNIWVGTGYGLCKYRGEHFTCYTTRGGFYPNGTRSIYEDHAGRLWVGKNDGLYWFANGKFTPSVPDTTLEKELINTTIEAPDGSFWFGTPNGLVHLQDGRITRYTTTDGLSNNYIHSIYCDAQGNLWIGTGGGGLVFWRDDTFTPITTANGLSNDVVYAVLEDSVGNLWMSCNKGVFRVKKQDLMDFVQRRKTAVVSTLYGIADGMLSSEANGGSPGALQSHDGRLWFPTVRGVAVVDPQHLTINKRPVPVVIERFGADEKDVESQRTIKLGPGTQRIEFQYTGLSFIAPDKVRFKYKLEGFDADWVNAGTRRSAYYTNLSPGRYRFHVMAENNDGVWSDSDTSLAFELQPHLYETYWFYALAIAAIVLSVIWSHRLRVRSLNRRQVLLETLVEERTKDLVDKTCELEAVSRRQADLVSGVSHQFKTPLTLIRLYGETLLYGEDVADDVRRHYYKIITRESARLNTMIDNVLSFSRIGRNVKAFRFKEGNLGTFVSEIANRQAEFLRSAGFEVDIQVNADLPQMSFDKAAIEQMLLNLLENAMKYSDTTKYVAIRLFQQEGAIALEVADTGTGIPDEDVDKIFEQFYRGSNASEKGGYGLGLFLVKRVVEAHHGRIEVTTASNRGTTFRVTFPLTGDATTEEFPQGETISSSDSEY